MNIAIITARGGSTRIVDKNMHPFCGKPLVYWSIKQAMESHLVDKVILTTDSPRIAQVGKEMGVIVQTRPVYNADLSAGIVLNEALSKFEATGVKVDNVVCLLPTSPLRKIHDIDDLIAFHIDNQSLETEVGIIPKELVLYHKLGKKGKQIIFDKQKRYIISCGGWGCWNPEFFHYKWERLAKCFKGLDKNIEEEVEHFDNKEKFVYILDFWQNFDIDYLEDLRFCEMIYKNYILGGLV